MPRPRKNLSLEDREGVVVMESVTESVIPAMLDVVLPPVKQMVRPIMLKGSSSGQSIQSVDAELAEWYAKGYVLFSAFVYQDVPAEADTLHVMYILTLKQ